jgi:hypothetical protein
MTRGRDVMKAPDEVSAMLRLKALVRSGAAALHVVDGESRAADMRPQGPG